MIELWKTRRIADQLRRAAKPAGFNHSIWGLLLADTKLDEIVPGRKYDFYILLHRLVQHNLYHAGQMMQFRRYLENNHR